MFGFGRKKKSIKLLEFKEFIRFMLSNFGNNLMMQELEQNIYISVNENLINKTNPINDLKIFEEISLALYSYIFVITQTIIMGVKE